MPRMLCWQSFWHQHQHPSVSRLFRTGGVSRSLGLDLTAVLFGGNSQSQCLRAQPGGHGFSAASPYHEGSSCMENEDSAALKLHITATNASFLVLLVLAAGCCWLLLAVAGNESARSVSKPQLQHP